MILNLKDFVCKPFPANNFSGRYTRKTILVDMVKYLASKVKHISRSLFDVLKQFNCKLRHSAANSFISSTFAVCTSGSLLSYFNSVFWISLFLFSTFPVLSYQRNNFTKACNFYKKKFFPSWVLVFISIYNLPKT